MEIYDYYAANGEHKFGFKIFTNDDKTILSYEASGFDSKAEAEERMKEVVAELLA